MFSIQILRDLFQVFFIVCNEFIDAVLSVFLVYSELHRLIRSECVYGIGDVLSSLFQVLFVMGEQLILLVNEHFDRLLEHVLVLLLAESLKDIDNIFMRIGCLEGF